MTPALRLRVLSRDGWCVAPALDPASGPCKDTWGDPERGAVWISLTLDHVRDHAMMGKRPPSDEAHLVTLCPHHHLNGWATGHRPLLREYLASLPR